MDLKRLGRGDVVAVGGGTLLLLSLSLPWFRVSGPGGPCDAGSCNAFDTFPILGPALVLAGFAPWILFYIIVRGNELSWPPGELTMIAGMVALVLILYNGLLDQPGANPNFVSLDVGWYLGTIGTLAIVGGGGMSQVSRGGVKRKPPGSF